MDFEVFIDLFRLLHFSYNRLQGLGACLTNDAPAAATPQRHLLAILSLGCFDTFVPRDRTVV